MTGGQKHPAIGRLVEICRGIGVESEHVRTIIPLRKHHKENVIVMKEELAFNGVSVIIAQRECIQIATKKKKAIKSK